ncbi:MAG TPA: chemotaxis protein CheW [Lamprocystis sp. (in: g-proteobacteria)]|nr:chemotaxis protein CheW [Lamprocystis sp. (in: g-proteobacteria)]
MPQPAPTPSVGAALTDSELEYWTGRYAQVVEAEQTGGRPFVVVSLGGERFAIGLQDLDEVAGVTSGIALPHVSPLVLGLANVRGELLPLLDTAALLGVGGGYRLGVANRTLVVRDRRGRRTGLPVDGIESVEELNPNAFQTAGEGEATAPIRRGGVGEHRGLALSLLDVTPLREGNFSHF